MAILFSNAPKKLFPKKPLLKSCIKDTCHQFHKTVGEISYVFVDDEELLEMNKQYLFHDFYTDIITFDNSEKEHEIEGDIYVSKDRVKENGMRIGNGILEEYVRVIAHGILHLCGFRDKTKLEIEEMRKQENAFIKRYTVKI